MKFTVEIKRLLKDARKATKAFCDVVIDDSIVIHDISVVDGKNGLFVAMPRSSWTNKQGEEISRDVVHPISSSARKEISTAVMAAYEAAKNSNGENAE